jgi:hypothetical protein
MTGGGSFGARGPLSSLRTDSFTESRGEPDRNIRLFNINEQSTLRTFGNCPFCPDRHLLRLPEVTKGALLEVKLDRSPHETYPLYMQYRRSHRLTVGPLLLTRLFSYVYPILSVTQNPRPEVLELHISDVST